MNNEIKEILVKLKEHLRYQKEVADVDSNVAYLRLTIGQYKLLLDYITNLQQENERLNHQLEVQKELTVRNRLRKHYYKSRIEKAVEYIKEDMYSEPNELYGLIDGEHLLNILNGRSDE